MSVRRWSGGRGGAWSRIDPETGEPADPTPILHVPSRQWDGSKRGSTVAECPRRGAVLVRLTCSCGARVLRTRCMSARCPHCAGYAVVPGPGPATARSRVATRRADRAAPKLGLVRSGRKTTGTILCFVMTVPAALRGPLATEESIAELRRHARDTVRRWLLRADDELVEVGGLAVIHPAGDSPGAPLHPHVEVLVPSIGVDRRGRARSLRRRRTLASLRALGAAWAEVLLSAADALGVDRADVEWVTSTPDPDGDAGDAHHPDTDSERRAVVHYQYRQGRRAMHRIRYSLRPWGNWFQGPGGRVSWWGGLGPASRSGLRDLIGAAPANTRCPCPTCQEVPTAEARTRDELATHAYEARAGPDGQTYRVPAAGWFARDAWSWWSLSS